MNNAELPTISIVTPSFNQGDFVEWTVCSVFEQRYPKLEYIFMDGGSGDKTLERVEQFRDRFAHFESNPDGGQSAAIAKGFAHATGEIMAYLNSDDVLLPGTLNFVAEYFRQHPAVDFVYGHRCIINENNKVIGHWILPPHSSFMMRRWDLIPQESCFWRRSLFEKKGNVDSTFRFAMDYDLFVRYMNTAKFKRVNRFLAAFRVHQDAKSSTQLATVGRQEVKRVQGKYKIHLPPFIGSLFSIWVQLRSAMWVRRRGAYPGLPPGVGFGLSDVWGGCHPLEIHGCDKEGK
jgi:glycosyltransferase involved in cell wall biosynthesis